MSTIVIVVVVVVLIVVEEGEGEVRIIQGWMNHLYDNNCSWYWW